MSFGLDSALESLAPDRWGATVHAHWGVVRGPFGGFLAALLARAATAPPVAWPARTLTIHFLDAPAPGAVEITRRLERRGRSSSAWSLRLEQEGRPMALALATVGERREGQPEWLHRAPPVLPAPQDAEPIPRAPAQPPFMERLDIRWAPGTAFWGAGEPGNSAWVSVREPLDTAALAALADVWLPPAFSLLGRPAVVPTLDLAIHFRVDPEPGDLWVLAAHRTDHAAGGSWTSDAELWDVRGRLLVQARQLALLRS